MEKRFNVTGLCNPDIHYMVNLEERLVEIKKMVDRGEYFAINRARQYGKTTILRALRDFLREEYAVISLSFQRMSSDSFRDEYSFSLAFAQAFLREVQNKRKGITGLNERELMHLQDSVLEDERFNLTKLFERLSDICCFSDRNIVLMIDEVDNASNNQVFLDFLGQLRDYYLDRDETATFQSVILAGVYDVRNLKQKIRPEEEHRYNSPWNVAADFRVDMSFSAEDISGMLTEYENDHHSGMDIPLVAGEIFEYTSGYPFLVSKICKLIDERVMEEGEFREGGAWTLPGIEEAVKILLREPNTLFDDMIKKLMDSPELRNMLKDILFEGKSYLFNLYNREISMGKMLGFLEEKNGNAVVSNRIFETHLYNWFLSEEMTESLIHKVSTLEKSQFIQNGMLNMDKVMLKFREYFTDIYSDSTDKFIEENGRRLFLLYLKPIINGEGNYYVEARTRSRTRTDVVVDYHGRQFVIELKVWHGEAYNISGEKQLADYLDDYHLKKGYLLTFNFNRKKSTGVKEVRYKDKTILEIMV